MNMMSRFCISDDFGLYFSNFFSNCFGSTKSNATRLTQGNAFGVVSTGIDGESQANNKWYRSVSMKLRQLTQS